MKFFKSNSVYMRLARTIVQAVIGVIIANLDILVAEIVINPTMKPVIVGLVMAVLSPIMAFIGETDNKDSEGL